MMFKCFNRVFEYHNFKTSHIILDEIMTVGDSS